MYKEYNMAKRKTKAEILAERPLETLSQMAKSENISQLRKDVRTLRTGYLRRTSAFKRKGLKSYAQIAVENSLQNTRRISVSKMSSNQLLLEYARYAKFFRDVTSTDKGIREVNKQQDIRIFGTDKNGNPIRRMTDSEREAYWSLYEEFINQNPDYNSIYQSGRIQQALGEINFPNKFEETDLTELFKKLKENLSEDYAARNRGGIHGVRRGRRNS